MVAADARHVLTWSLTAGQAGDAPQGRQLIQVLGPQHGRVALLMDSAYQDDLRLNWRPAWALSPSCHPARSDLSRGTMTSIYTVVATKLNASSVE